jgi:hypothetical protein
MVGVDTFNIIHLGPSMVGHWAFVAKVGRTLKPIKGAAASSPAD